jgi:hypothetical protein
MNAAGIGKGDQVGGQDGGRAGLAMVTSSMTAQADGDDPVAAGCDSRCDTVPRV